MSETDPNKWISGIPGGVGTTGEISGTGLPANYVPPSTKKTVNVGSGRGSRSGIPATSAVIDVAPRKTAAGNYGVVDADTGEVREFYQPTREAMIELSKLDNVERRLVQQLLYAKGWYGSRKPGNGYSDSDRGAMADLLLLANVQGVTWRTLLKQVGQAPTENLSLTGATRPSSADLAEILQSAALTTMGKKLPEDAVKNLVAGYQSVSTGESTEQAPSADVYFKNRIEQTYGTDTDAHKYLNAISSVANILGGM